MAPPGGRARRSARTWAPIVAPLLLTMAFATWQLWTRGDPARQGGYCVNATREISSVLRRADTDADVGRGPLPDVQKILASVRGVDVRRLQVHTPSSVRTDVAVLARRLPILEAARGRKDPQASEAFARIAADYLKRCRGGG